MDAIYKKQKWIIKQQITVYLNQCDIFCQVVVAGALTEPDTAPDMKVMVNVGSLVLYRSHSQLLPFS